VRRQRSRREGCCRKAEGTGLITLEPFTVNLADPGGSRFLRLSLRLVIESPEEAEKAQKNSVLLTRIRSSILELLAQQTADSLITPQGKAALKTTIAEHVTAVLKEIKVTDVLSPILLSSSEPPAAAVAPPHPFAGLLDVPCFVEVFLGTGRITVRDCLKLQRLSIIRLHQTAGADLDVRIEGVSVAFGEAVIVDESTAVRISTIVPPRGLEGRA